MKSAHTRLDDLEKRIPKPSDQVIERLNQRPGVFIVDKWAFACIAPYAWQQMSDDEQDLILSHIRPLLLDPDEL